MKIQREIKTSHQQNLVHTLFEEQETILLKGQVRSQEAKHRPFLHSLREILEAAFGLGIITIVSSFLPSAWVSSHLIFCAFFQILWAFWILEICSIFIEFYLFIILFFIVIICLFTLYFFKCIIILIAVRKNDIHLIQIKYCLSHFQFFFLTHVWMMFLLANFLWSKLLISVAFSACFLKYSEHEILSSQ